MVMFFQLRQTWAVLELTTNLALSDLSITYSQALHIKFALRIHRGGGLTGSRNKNRFFLNVTQLVEDETRQITLGIDN